MTERRLIDISSCQRMLRLSDLYTYKGKISKVMGLTVEATGLTCNVGDICEIWMDEHHGVVAEVVGLQGSIVQLMPYEEVDGIGAGSIVVNTGDKLEIGVGPEMVARYPINGVRANPMERPPISQVIQLGVKAIDGLLTIGKGQRMGIFAGSGVGKSTLMGMIARNVKADVNVIALVGERGRELVELIHDALQMRPYRHRHRRVFPGPGKGRPADDGLPHPVLHGPAGDWPFHRGTSGSQGLHPLYLYHAA